MFVATKASSLSKNVQDSYQSVTFHSRTKKASNPDGTGRLGTSEEKSIRYTPDDMKKLRYEIIKFGTSGFTGEQKEDANVALMVSLGAEPPKNKAKNYKEMLKEKMKKKSYENAINEKKYPSSALPHKRTVDPKLRKRKKDVKGLLNIYGEVKKGKKKRLRK